MKKISVYSVIILFGMLLVVVGVSANTKPKNAVKKSMVAKPKTPTKTTKPIATPIKKPIEVKPKQPVKKAPTKVEKKPTITHPKEKTKKSSMSKGEIIDIIFKLLLGLVSLVFIVLQSLDKMAWAKKERAKKIWAFLDLGFNAVEGLVKGTKTDVDDKLLEFFKRVNAMLKESGNAELTAKEKAAATEYAANRALAEKKLKKK